ncbi:Striatin-interacting protein 1 [Phytophthora cinnamomi]|uniref:Striatin-interacting protein 1 n=1 Tax=Phytophthora cinnamomi TaxID=4785 RepID=UPI003559CBAE|nr:Striatin-interacting protein 1 [Phytophthora cinnamomi]
MEVAPTLDDAQALRQLTIADEHLMICLCGVGAEQDGDARMLQEAMQKIVRIKLQMGSNHQISLAKAQHSRLVVVQEFTQNVEAAVAAVPGVLDSTERDDMVDLDALLADAAHYFRGQREMERQAASSFRLLLLYWQSPQLHATQAEVSLAFINDPSFHLDVIYWHQDVPQEAAQSVFDQFCAFDSTNPFAKFYFLEIGGSLERLHQAFVLMLSHPAHRLSQNAAEQLLGSWFSPSKEINSLGQQD